MSSGRTIEKVCGETHEIRVNITEYWDAVFLRHRSVGQLDKADYCQKSPFPWKIVFREDINGMISFSSYQCVEVLQSHPGNAASFSTDRKANPPVSQTHATLLSPGARLQMRLLSLILPSL